METSLPSGGGLTVHGAASFDRDDIDDGSFSLDVRPHVPQCPAGLGSCCDAVLVIHLCVWLLQCGCVLFGLPPSAVVVILAGAWRAQAVQWLPSERVHALGVVLEINKAVAIVQFHLKLSQHGKPQKAGNLRPGVAAYGGEVQRDDV
jgi:hypothetical protein